MIGMLPVVAIADPREDAPEAVSLPRSIDRRKSLRAELARAACVLPAGLAIMSVGTAPARAQGRHRAGTR